MTEGSDGTSGVASSFLLALCTGVMRRSGPRANVLSRGIVGDLNGELVVASPVYKQHFSLASGRCLEDQGVCVAVFPARVEGDMVLAQA